MKEMTKKELLPALLELTTDIKRGLLRKSALRRRYIDHISRLKHNMAQPGTSVYHEKCLDSLNETYNALQELTDSEADAERRLTRVEKMIAELEGRTLIPASDPVA